MGGGLHLPLCAAWEPPAPPASSHPNYCCRLSRAVCDQRRHPAKRYVRAQQHLQLRQGAAVCSVHTHALRHHPAVRICGQDLRRCGALAAGMRWLLGGPLFVGLPLLLHGVHAQLGLPAAPHFSLKPRAVLHPASPAAVEISPLKDEACAEPGQSYWSSIRIRGRYVTPAKIATMLNTVTTNLTRWACAEERGEQDACHAGLCGQPDRHSE